MQDSNAEQIIHQNATTPEGLMAQTKIVQDLFTGEGLRPATAETTLEKYYRDFLADHNGKARDELQTVMGLSSEQLTPTTQGQEVELDPDGTKKVIQYFLEIGKVDEIINKFETGGDVKSIEQSEFLKKYLQALHDGTSVHVIGPLLQMRFKTEEAYLLFNVLFSDGNARGTFSPLPLPPTEPGKHREESKHVLVNFVLEEDGEEMPGQSAHKHELWHAIDYFRRVSYQEIKPVGGETKAFEHPEGKDKYTQENRFKERLDAYFFEAPQLVSALRNVQWENPEMYNYYTKLDPTLFEDASNTEGMHKNSVEVALEKSFFTVQAELPAFIAGFLNGTDTNPITNSRKQAIIDKLVLGYMPFGLVSLNDLRWNAKQDQEGKWIVDERMVGYTFNPRAASVSLEPDIKRETMLDKYSQRGGLYGGSRTSVNTQVYTEDLQKVMDFFLNAGGPGYEAIEKSRASVEKSIDAYKKLAEYRKNPYQALVELSLLPISHWDIYTKSKTR